MPSPSSAPGAPENHGPWHWWANSTWQGGDLEPSMAPAMPRQEHSNVIDRIRHDIQQRLDQLFAEAAPRARRA
jgi:hypothetical protein